DRHAASARVARVCGQPIDVGTPGGRQSAEVAIEGTILLHENDDVLDRNLCAARRRGREGVARQRSRMEGARRPAHLVRIIPAPAAHEEPQYRHEHPATHAESRLHTPPLSFSPNFHSRLTRWPQPNTAGMEPRMNTDDHGYSRYR